MKHIQPFTSYLNESSIRDQLQAQLGDADVLGKQLLKGTIDPEYKAKLSKLFGYEMISPSQEYEQEHGLTGISFNWNNPFDLTWAQLENMTYFFTDYHPKWINFIFKKLVAANPSLKSIDFAKISWKFFHAKASIIGGVCSSFNIDDIKEYIYYSRENLSMPTYDNPDADLIIAKNGEPDQKYSELMTRLHKLVANPGWFPSTKTIKKIIAQKE